MALDLMWPLAFAPNGRERTVVQGSLEEVQQGVDLLMSTPAGALPYAKQFGRPELAHDPDPEGAMRRFLAHDEVAPRVGVLDVAYDRGAFTITVLSVNAYPEAP